MLNCALGHPADFAIRPALGAEAKEAVGSSGAPFSAFLISRQNDGARKTGVPIKERSAKLRYPGHFGGNANGIKMHGIFAAFPGLFGVPHE